jgi:hypothetical protein
MTGLDRVVVLALGLSAASVGLAMRAALPSLRQLRVEQEQAAERVQHLLTRIVQNADRFDRSLGLSDDRGGIDETRPSEAFGQVVHDFRQAAVRLRDRASDRRASALDVEEVLRRGAGIDGLTQRHRLSVAAEQVWFSLSADLDRLAQSYATMWNGSTVQAGAPW